MWSIKFSIQFFFRALKSMHFLPFELNPEKVKITMELEMEFQKYLIR